MATTTPTADDVANLKRRNHVLTQELAQARAELSDAHQSEAATAELLKVIGRSSFDLQKVLDTLVESAMQLCESSNATIVIRDGNAVVPRAHMGPAGVLPLGQRQPLNRRWVTGRAVLDGETVHVPDLLASDEYPDGKAMALQFGHRATLASPLMREGVAIGAILLRRGEARGFTPAQIALLQTFADQAVIAIENTRLFEEVQARTRELTESLQQQTATADVLKVISRSAFDIQAVLTTLVESAGRLCRAENVQIFLRDGEVYRLAADNGLSPEYQEYMRQNPISPGRGTLVGRTALERALVHMPDVLADPEYTFREGRRLGGFRAMLGVPLLREGSCVGVMSMTRPTPQPFTAKQIELVTTFADQAVIAIENTRLFEEVQARTRDLQESLSHQTATSDVLGVISRSKFDLQPVLNALVESAAKLCNADIVNIWLPKGANYLLAASYGAETQRDDWQAYKEYLARVSYQPARGSVVGRTLLEGTTIQIEDIRADSEYDQRGALSGVRTMLGVPLLRDGKPIGVMVLVRAIVHRFTDKQVELIQTFADQAVIAIENTRLFEQVQSRTRELGRSVQELRSLGAVAQAVSSSLELKVVLDRILQHACAMSEAGGGAIYVLDKARGQFDLEAGHNMSNELITQVRQHPIRSGESVVGQCVERRQAVQIDDLAQAPPHPIYDMLIKAGVRALLAVPLLHQDEVIGALVVRRMQASAFTPDAIGLLQSFADQSAVALENARLFNEIAQKSRELEIASQHKSQFVANMSHELRTPLAAILGYAELMQEGFYEPQGPKSLDALTRIRSNGKHLLGLINTVLDIAKIESGQFSLNMAEYAIDSVIETVRVATESLAQNKKLAFKTEVAKSLPIGLGDEQRLTQVLLNLVGNAIKFTDTGEVRITATAVTGHIAVSVTDTGPGIPPEEQKRIFEQFHQIDNSMTKAKGGTGLGLAIAKQIVEMHGGRIWVESTPGKGATFQMKLPTRAEFRIGDR